MTTGTGIAYQINIFNPITDHVSDFAMLGIRIVLHTECIALLDPYGSGYQNQGARVYVDSNDLARAVHAINDAGYTTDEDADPYGDMDEDSWE